MDRANATLGPVGWAYDLFGAVDQDRSDLQAAFPNAYTNSTTYASLLVWAAGVVERLCTDSAYTELSVYASYYEEFWSGEYAALG